MCDPVMPTYLLRTICSGDAIHTGALNLFMRDFDFTVDALDVALRRLLMVVSLPKETQQIDRVMEAFAKRYDQCHPGLLKESGRWNTWVK
jgi:Sec7-like guanine-nucleotide exchange factor